MNFFGVKLVGFNQENAHKLILTFVFIGLLLIVKKLLIKFFSREIDSDKRRRFYFWSKQSINLLSTFIITLTFLSIWFDDPKRLSTGLGLFTAGLAFALQKVVTSLAGYIMIIRGNTFTVGDRITMGGIRGDVIALGFLQTTIMEMGQPPSVQNADPAIWVQGRQYTGRIVSITNDKIFEEPVYNYTRDFPFLWEEIQVPIKYTDDYEKAEELLYNCVYEVTSQFNDLSQDTRSFLVKKYGIKTDDVEPQIFLRLTDNWIELSARFIAPEHGIRKIKDQISRALLEKLKANNISIASATMDITVTETSIKKNKRQNSYEEQQSKHLI